jgi:hypothetical protein
MRQVITMEQLEPSKRGLLLAQLRRNRPKAKTRIKQTSMSKAPHERQRVTLNKNYSLTDYLTWITNKLKR